MGVPGGRHEVEIAGPGLALLPAEMAAEVDGGSVEMRRQPPRGLGPVL